MSKAPAISRLKRAASLAALCLAITIPLAPASTRAGLADLITGFLTGPVAGWHVAALPGLAP